MFTPTMFSRRRGDESGEKMPPLLRIERWGEPIFPSRRSRPDAEQQKESALPSPSVPRCGARRRVNMVGVNMVLA